MRHAFKHRLQKTGPSRRQFLRLCPFAIASFTFVTCDRRSKETGFANPGHLPTAQTKSLSLTPTCGAEEATLSQIEGPFYTPDSPERTSLIEPGFTGTPIILTGQVLSSSCIPIADALLDFWHADDQGQYDNTGYTLRGHQFSDTEGRYRLETIIPGIYPGRTRHFHVRVQTKNQQLLTTQLYFPNERSNEQDGLFQPELLISLTTELAAKQATFDFIL